MPHSISSLFYARLQQDNVPLIELVDLTLPTGSQFHWTTANDPITYTLSGAPTTYTPFPGAVPSGIEESIDLAINVVDFTLTNSSQEIQKLLTSDDFRTATVNIGRVFSDTPDLGRMEIYRGTIGDFSHNRQTLTGQARSLLKSNNVQWPSYNYQDTCAWRFGGTGCGFNTSSITSNIGSVNVGSSTTVNILLPTGTLSAYQAGRFDFGRLTVTGGVNSGYVRTIRIHTGDLIQLSHPLPISSFSNMSVAIFPGCRKRLVEDCKSLYNNDKNFLGWPWIPKQEQAW